LVTLKVPFPNPAYQSSSSSSSLSSSSSSAASRSNRYAHAEDPFISIQLNLDHILPRITQLCTAQSTDAQLTSVACECLHALTVYLVGASTKNFRDKGRADEFVSTYKHVLPVLIQLSSNQLFHKLLFQIIRWFSGVDQVGDAEVSVLVDCLETGLCNSTDEGIRDVASKGLSEFLKWTIKQSTKKQLATSSASAETLFGRLFVMLGHPRLENRLGALLVINGIYKDFREETSLVSKYALRMLYMTLKALTLQRQGGDSSGALATEAETAVKNVMKIVVKTIDERGDIAALHK
jgi:DNA-dependent protein kinase catalytic subunit